jgi:hypothetical protein
VHGVSENDCCSIFGFRYFNRPLLGRSLSGALFCILLRFDLPLNREPGQCAATRVIAPAPMLPANPIQSDDFILSPVAIETGIPMMMTVPKTSASDISHSGLSPGRLLFFILGTCRAGYPLSSVATKVGLIGRAARPNS